MAESAPIAAKAETHDYNLLLQIGPMEKMFSAATVANRHLSEGEVMVGGKMTMVMPKDEAVTHHLEVHVHNKADGQVVPNAMVTIMVSGKGLAKPENVTPAIIYGIKQGAPDTHFGNNVALPAGSYTINVSVNDEKARFKVIVPAS